MPHGRLFWKVYSHGVLLLVVIAVAVGVTGWAIGRAPPPWHTYPERVERYLSARSGDLADPALLARDLKRERELLGLDMSVYRLDGSLIASNVQPPLPPLSGDAVSRLHRGFVHAPKARALAVPVREAGHPIAYVMLGALPFATRLTHGAVMLAVVLVVVAVGSFPLARAITSPLERVTAAAQRLGSGDLTARAGLRRSDEVGALATAFDEMAGRLEELVRGEKELLANVSHELRTPMARIRLALELAAEGDAERARAYLSEITTDVAELERLVEDVLLVARMDLIGARVGAPPLRRARLPAEAILERAAERFRAAHPDRVLEVRIDGALPQLDADEALLRRALDNLLDNARKYSPAERPVVLSAAAAEGLTVEVRDEGIGMDADDLANLFRPFFRTERSRSRGTGGVGLGLALARKVIEAHGGRIGVTSTPGKGTTVRFQVPAAR